MLSVYADSDHCEWIGGCSETFGLANAHRLKKTKISIREEWVHGRAKLCEHHHNHVEHGPHARMWNLVTDIIRLNRPDLPIPMLELPDDFYITSDRAIYEMSGM